LKPAVEPNAFPDEQSHESAAPPPPPRDDRRLVEISGYVIRSNKAIVDVKVLDLSYDGCLISTLVPLLAGETVKLSALGRGATAATVRWYKDRKAGLLFQSEPVTKQHWTRKAERLPVRAEVSLRRVGRLSYRVTTFDVSRFGCSSEFIERPGVYEHMWVKFDGLESIEAVAVWIEESRVGLMYKSPMHTAVFDLLLARLRLTAEGELDLWPRA
jgi:hypothetical protein